MPVDAVVLGLHGAMVADGYDDLQGDLHPAWVRDIVGSRQGAGLRRARPAQPSPPKKRATAAGRALTVFKEFPHIDFVDRARDPVQRIRR